MTKPNIARAAILRTEIAALFVQPSKRTLRQSEALDLLAKVDGVRSHNVVPRTPSKEAATLPPTTAFEDGDVPVIDYPGDERATLSVLRAYAANISLRMPGRQAASAAIRNGRIGGFDWFDTTGQWGDNSFESMLAIDIAVLEDVVNGRFTPGADGIVHQGTLDWARDDDAPTARTPRMLPVDDQSCVQIEWAIRAEAAIGNEEAIDLLPIADWIRQAVAKRRAETFYDGLAIRCTPDHPGMAVVATEDDRQYGFEPATTE